MPHFATILIRAAFLVCLLLRLTGASILGASISEPIYSFSIPPAGPLGELVEAPDHSFYGTASAGGSSGAGTVFKIGADGAFRTLVEFTGYSGLQRGAQPSAKLVIGSDGNYYGVTAQGGAGGFGTLFKLLPDGTSITVLAFTGAGVQFRGAFPYAALLAGGDGYLYGTTSQGGLANLGTVFKVSEADGSLTTLAEFGGKIANIKGANPFAALIKGPDGLLYGTTAKGGKMDHGTVFSITTGGTLTTLIEFTDRGPKNKGAAPYGPLAVSADGTFYGTTARGGASDFGTLFKMTAAGGLTTLLEFSGRSGKNRGAQPEAGLIAGPDASFYSTTFSGGSGNLGTVFKVTPDGKLTTLIEFTGTGGNGAQPQAGLLLAQDGFFYGTTLRGGAGDAGTVFKMSAAGELSNLLEFSGVDSTYSQGGIIRGKDTNFYGVTAANGLLGKGTVFRITPAGVTKTLAEFAGSGGINAGSLPKAPLLQARDGNFYGVTVAGGAHDMGTIFKITPSGLLTTLIEFTGNGASNKGASPRAALIQAGDGNLYGVTSAGGGSNAGTIFRLGTDGVLTTLVEFTGNGEVNKGASPDSSLLFGRDLKFHGTTAKGGAKGLGTVFSMTAEGVLTTQAEFADDPAGIKGAIPEGALIEGSDGNFYGTTATGGATGDGTLFRMSTVLTTLVEFTGRSGQNKGTGPTGALFAASDGNLYGTTAFGGAANYGTAFRMTLKGELTTLAELAYTDGAYPETGFVQGTDGNLYTTTSFGGDSGAGAIFRLRMRAAAGEVDALAVTSESTQLHAVLKMGGLEAIAYFEYGVDSYDHTTAALLVPSGSVDATALADLTGLQANTVYFFRTVVVDSSGTVYGHDESFTTGPLATEVLSAGGVLDQEPVSTTLTDFGIPSIADNQEVAVLANLMTAAGKETAILAGTPPSIVVRKGSSIPGQGGTFISFKDPVCDAAGKVAFAASFQLGAKPGFGLWTNAGGALAEVARVGGGAAGVNGARLATISSYAMSEGTVFYAGTLGGAGVSAANNMALWAFDGNGNHLLLRRGDTLNGRTITTILALSPVAGSMGQGRGYFGNTLTARVTLSDRSQAIVQLAPGVEPMVIGPTPFALASPSIEVAGLGVPSISAGGTAAFVAALSNQKPAIVADSDTLAIVAQIGSPAPGAAPAVFATFADPVYNVQSQTAFLAALSGTGVSGKTRNGLWWNSSTGLSLVARAGSDVPTISGAKWDSFLSVALPDNAGPLFLAKLAASAGIGSAGSTLAESPGGHNHGFAIAASVPAHAGSSAVNLKNNVGLFSVDANKARRLLVRTGDVLQVQGISKTVSLISVLSAVLGSPGQARSYNATGDVVFRATFTDHTQAIMRIHLP